MNECKDIESLIPGYLEGRLEVGDARRLLAHLKACPDCRDEMEINFLLEEGIRRVESGETLNLDSELDKKLHATEETLLLLDRIRSGIYIVEGTAAFMIAACFLMLFLS